MTQTPLIRNFLSHRKEHEDPWAKTRATVEIMLPLLSLIGIEVHQEQRTPVFSTRRELED